MASTTFTDRALLRLSGEDVRGFLQGLVTQDMAGPLPAWAGLLTPQGKALFDFLVWLDGADLLIDAEAAQVDGLARRLTMYRLCRPITIAREEGLAVHWSVDRPATPGAVPDPRLPALGWRWLAPADGPAEGWLAHRLALGVAEGAAEFGSGDTLWLECNARELGGVSFTKGCYVGQENTARMHHRAKVNRRLVVAPLGDDERARARYPELGLMVTHRRVEALGDALRPAWLTDALAVDARAVEGAVT
jgi:folate-binding protein YgfZ